MSIILPICDGEFNWQIIPVTSRQWVDTLSGFNQVINSRERGGEGVSSRKTKRITWKSPDGIEWTQIHVVPRAYCETRVSDWEAIFAVCDLDGISGSSTGRVRVTGWRHEKVEVEQGKMYRLVYRSCDSAGWNFAEPCLPLTEENLDFVQVGIAAKAKKHPRKKFPLERGLKQ